VGLTGGFGSGKSTAARLFKKLGARVVDADQLAHEVFRKGHPLFPKVRSLFPEAKGSLTRARAARVIFGNPKRRRALEALIHPYVFQRMREEISRTKAPVIVLEVPLLFESGFDRDCDVTVAVVADRKEIFRRLHPLGRAAILARLGAQMPVREKTRRADYVIENSRGLRELEDRVKKLWHKFKKGV